MRLKVSFFALLVSLMATSCGDPGAKVEALANAVYNEQAKKIDNEKAVEYITACENFATNNPKDPRSPEWLLKAAETARNISQHDRAIAIYDNVMAKFPDYPKVSQALFLKAFTIDDNMNKKEEAKALYEEFLTKYPNDDFAESAQFMLSNLFKSDAQIIEEFEKNRVGSGAVEDAATDDSIQE